MNQVEHFELGRGIRWRILVAPWVCIAITLFGMSLPFLPGGRMPPLGVGRLGLSFAMICSFGAFAWHNWRSARELPKTAVSVDHDGIWTTVSERSSALVPWCQVVGLREHPRQQRLELLGASGQSLVKLEYQLQGFSRLRRIVLERAALPTLASVEGQVFAKKARYHLAHALLVVVMLFIGLYIWHKNPWFVGGTLTAVLGGVAWAYLSTVSKVQLFQTQMCLSWPFRQRMLLREDIVSVDVSDEFTQNGRTPLVLLRNSRAVSPIKLRSLGVPAVELARVLNAWRSKQV